MRDITIGETIDVKFTTTEPDTGLPATLSGTPVVSAYVGNSTTQITAGITLSADFDGVTGLNNVRVVATSGNGYTDGSDVSLVITTGTVDAVSAVGYVIEQFTIGRGAAFTRLGAPAGASVSADIAAIEAQTDDIGAAGAGLTAVPWNAAWDAEVQSECADALTAYDPPTNTELIAEIDAVQADIAGITAGTSPDVLVDTTIATLATQTSFTLTAGSADDDAYNGMAVIFTDQATAAQKWVCFVSDYTGSTKTVTLESAPGFTIATGDEVAIMAAGGSTSVPVTAALADGGITAAKIASDAFTAAKFAADVTTEFQSGLATAAALATVDSNVDAILLDTAEIGTAGAGLTNINLPNQTMDIVGNITGNLSGSVGSVTGAVGSVAGAVGSVTGAVGSVTGNVDGNVTGTIGGLATQAKADVNAEVDAAVADLVSGVITGAAATGTLSTTQATTDLTGYADDQFIGRIVIWLSGACEGEASDISDYANTGGLLTFTALTIAPGNGDTFKIV
jgi:hypothetical protein